MDENGAAVILKNNASRYIVIEYSKVQKNESADDQMVEDVAKQILAKHAKAFEELSK
ncbi:type II toxin-antitoxin system Phd/YefM family antitoxin [Clostridium hydrogenum]|uniref:type II toxin-antitoxin system Phd/YefM family antitoxin n=1 Tax=Clostridium hydrogenum TaxID=2855764 RepID=UPI002E358385|nr:type II toxin-antitoxin system Phd/YefM family antitoxin [Clostridium hydrogenum]